VRLRDVVVLGTRLWEPGAVREASRHAVDSAAPSEAAQAVDLLRWDDGRALADRDLVAREEPLEIQLRGATLAVTMRTPGHDGELVRGFLVTERVVSSLADVEAVRHCSDAAPEAEDNVVRVTLRAGVRPDLERLRRNLFASSSCGVCGKATLENALAAAPPLDDATRLRASVLVELPARLRAAQPAFDETGGLHAAGLFDGDGRLLVAREDVGRHNAVDKVVGWAARAGRLHDLEGRIELVLEVAHGLMRISA